MAGLKVGVTLGRASQNATEILWSAGIHQNAIFLMLLFRRMPEVSFHCIVDCSEFIGPNPLAEYVGVPTLQAEEAIGELDILLEFGARPSADYVARFRERGGKYVSYMAGNGAAMNFESLACKSAGGEILTGAVFDAVWMTEQHWHMNRAWCELLRSPITEIVPHIWDPICLEASIGAYRSQFFWKDAPRPTGWRIGTFAPNINVVKTFHIPLLAVEEAYRAAPKLIDRLLLFNTQHLVGWGHFDELTGACDLAKHNKVFAEGRHAIASVLGTHVDAVVEHQWENNLNYVYWDVLYSGYPLIHNSDQVHAGYFYKPFDTQDGGRVIVDALSRHAGRAQAYRAEALDFLWRFRVDNPVVLSRHAELIAQVMG